MFYMSLKVILYFRAFSFCSKCFFVFFLKNWFKGCFARSSRLRASHEMCLREITVTFSYSESHYCLVSISRLNSSHKMFLGKNWKIFISYQGNRDCFMTKCFSRKPQCVSRLIPRLSNPRKTRVFSFYIADVTVFQTLCFPSRCLSRTPLNPKSIFSQPHHFQAKIFAKSLQGMFS